MGSEVTWKGSKLFSKTKIKIYVDMKNSSTNKYLEVGDVYQYVKLVGCATKVICGE